MKKIKRWDKSCQIWKLETKVRVKTGIKGVDFKSAYLDISVKGELDIKRGYAWNGCSPKTAILGMVFGTPEGALPNPQEKDRIKGNLENLGYTDLHWQKPKTYYATLIHDSLYQISDHHAEKMDRKTADLIFLAVLKACRFPAAKLYYLVVRILGKYYWGVDPE